MGELLQIRFPRHADAAGDEVVPLSPQVQFRKEFRVLVVLAVGRHCMFFCNHYTAEGQEKDSAFSYPKPKLLLTKPKLFVPKPDKNLPSRKVVI